MDKDSLKEYYVKLQNLYNNAVNMLTAINQSLSTTSSEISITITDEEDSKTKVRIPSFLYLENKIEQLTNNFSNLFEMPSSGQAWFSNENNMYKLKMVQSNVAPVKPIIDDNSIKASLKQNTFLKDFVNPRTFLRINIDNVPNNVEKMFMKKIVIFDNNVFSEIQNRQEELTTYQDYVAALSNLTEGVEYEEYDSILDMPIKREEFDSEFRIIEIPELESGNPYYSSNIDNPTSKHNDSHLVYQIRLNTLIYRDHDDPSIEYQLKIGDQLSLEGNFTIYKVKSISKYQDSITDSLVTLEEIAGHTSLQTYEANSSMVLKMYKSNYNEYKYIEVPLEENDHIVIFLSLIDSNVRSTYSSPILVDLNSVYMYNENGTLMKDPATGQNITYIDYYNKYCINIGDILQGISDTIQPQFTNINNSVLNTLENDETIQLLVTNSINKENIEVTCINEHLFDDASSKQIVDLYSEKNQYSLSLSDIQANIDNTYNLLTTTDFNTDLTLTQESLKAKLDDYYTQRLSLNKEYINVVNRIAALKAENNLTQSSKYRIRGFIDFEELREYIKGTLSDKCELIGVDIEYKYIAVSSNQASVTQINNNVFTNWNKYKSIDKERILKFDKNNLYTIEYVEYSDSDNNIKWNQIDIPINQGEDVAIRIRYKYNIGQPFINFYSPWSDNVIFEFPEKFMSNNEVVDIITDNDNDVSKVMFMNTLINDGYEEHINNKIIDNSQVYYHMPENIYSGFNTAENKLISLKDKLLSMSNDIDKYKSVLSVSSNENYKVYLEYDSNVIELHNSTDNIINFNESHNVYSSFFTRKTMNIVIKNIGENTLNLYSIFNGNSSVSLLNVTESYINNSVEHYQRVPLLIAGTDDIDDIMPQSLGQWIYFRQNNPYTLKDIYYSDNQQNNSDISVMLSNINNSDKQYYVFTKSLTDYISTNNAQALLPNKSKSITSNTVLSYYNLTDTNKTRKFYWSSNNENIVLSSVLDSTDTGNYEDSTFNQSSILDFTKSDDYTKYRVNQKDNNYVLKYEHIEGTLDDTRLNDSTDIDIFIREQSPRNVDTLNSLHGMFLFPELPTNTHLLCSNTELSKQYKSIPAGNTLSIPVVVEYFLPDNRSTSIQKTICFDLKPSVDRDLDHYIIKVIVKKNQIDKDYSETITGYESDNIS